MLVTMHWSIITHASQALETSGTFKDTQKVSEDEIPDIKSPACELEIPLLSINQDKITGFS
jgi:hypothetical protein